MPTLPKISDPLPETHLFFLFGLIRYWSGRLNILLIKGAQAHWPSCLKGTATLMISMFYQKELYRPWILIQVSSKSVEKWASYWHLKNSIWPTFSRHFEYLISFSNFFNCLIFSYHCFHIICVSADMQLYTHKENVSLKIYANNPLVCLLFWLHIFN